MQSEHTGMGRFFHRRGRGFSHNAAQKQVAGAACCDSGNTTCAAGLSCITGYCDIKRISAKRKLTTDRLKNNHIIHFNLVGAPVMM